MNWNQQRETIESKINAGIEPKDIAKELGVMEYDLRQFIHRTRIFPRKAKKAMAFELVNIYTRGHPEYFRPNRDFFKDVRIRQKHWWSLYRGEKVMTQEEYMRVTKHLNITLHEAFEARQLNWVDELDNQR